MNAWATLDHLSAIASAPRRRARSGDLVERIADGLATSGVFEIQGDLLPIQSVVDFNWAARQAGRLLGIRVHIEVQHPRAADKRAQVRVTPLRPPE